MIDTAFSKHTSCISFWPQNTIYREYGLTRPAADFGQMSVLWFSDEQSAFVAMFITLTFQCNS